MKIQVTVLGSPSLIERTVSEVVIKPTLNDAGAVIHGDDERCKRHRACGRYSNSR